MTKYSKVNGKYLIKGKSYEMLTGSRAQVYHGTAYKTSGNLKKTDLVQNKHGRMVSALKYKSSKQKGKNNLFNKGYSAKKGHFGAVRNGLSISRKKTLRHSRKRIRGGTHTPEHTDPGSSTTSNIPPPSTYTPNDTPSTLALNATQIGGKSRRSRKRGGKHKQLFLG